jgi:hypothetical protein
MENGRRVGIRIHRQDNLDGIARAVNGAAAPDAPKIVVPFFINEFRHSTMGDRIRIRSPASRRIDSGWNAALKPRFRAV